MTLKKLVDMKSSDTDISEAKMKMMSEVSR